MQDSAPGTGGPGDTNDGEGGIRALEKWRDFPILAEPRPNVLCGPTVLCNGGFANGQAKLAFSGGHFEPSESVSAEAVELLRTGLGSQGAGPYGVGPLRLQASVLDEGEFLTDRGPRRLPAWRVVADGALGEIVVLASSGRELCWQPTSDEAELPRGGRPETRGMALSGDGTRLALRFVGLPETVAEYTGTLVVESEHAVAVKPIEKWIGPSRGWVALAGATREVELRLDKPLGGRVLIDHAARAIPVY